MSTSGVLTAPRFNGQPLLLALAAAVTATLLSVIWVEVSGQKALLFAIGLALGVSLYHGAFGFAGAYRKALEEKDITGIAAQLLMLAAAMLLFAPILAQGRAFGHGIGPSVAPVNTAVVFGAFLFGIGMQIAGACASGTLFTVGGVNPRMMLVLVFFVAGTFWGSLDLAAWQRLPGIGAVSLAQKFGLEVALPMQLAGLAAIYGAFRLTGGRVRRPLWADSPLSWRGLLYGPWPLLLSGTMLAVLNWATLLVAGHAWSITWGFTLWGGKVAASLGWDPASSSFWTGNFQQTALGRSILYDTTSVMNIGIILGALIAAALAGRIRPRLAWDGRSLAAAILGGLAMGYGARLAYGCNIGAMFSGIASFSLHGWVWLGAALVGCWFGIRLRPLFGMSRR